MDMFPPNKPPLTMDAVIAINWCRDGFGFMVKYTTPITCSNKSDKLSLQSNGHGSESGWSLSMFCQCLAVRIGRGSGLLDCSMKDMSSPSVLLLPARRRWPRRCLQG